MFTKIFLGLFQQWNCFYNTACVHCCWYYRLQWAGSTQVERFLLVTYYPYWLQNKQLHKWHERLLPIEKDHKCNQIEVSCLLAVVVTIVSLNQTKQSAKISDRSEITYVPNTKFVKSPELSWVQHNRKLKFLLVYFPIYGKHDNCTLQPGSVYFNLDVQLFGIWTDDNSKHYCEVGSGSNKRPKYLLTLMCI